MNWHALGIIIPTFRRAATVARTVELLQRNLTYSGPIEVIVSEDGPDLPVIAGANVRVVKGPGAGWAPT